MPAPADQEDLNSAAEDTEVEDKQAEDDSPREFSLIGDLNESEATLTEQLLEVPEGGECVIYFNCPGGNPHSAISLMSLMLMRRIQATGVVLGECSSAALWPLAACKRRIVTPYSVLLFHPMKSESEENISLVEAAEWVRYFSRLEKEMDVLLADVFAMPLDKLNLWMQPGKFVGGAEFAAAGLAELVQLQDLLQR